MGTRHKIKATPTPLAACEVPLGQVDYHAHLLELKLLLASAQKQLYLTRLALCMLMHHGLMLRSHICDRTNKPWTIP